MERRGKRGAAQQRRRHYNRRVRPPLVQVDVGAQRGIDLPRCAGFRGERQRQITSRRPGAAPAYQIGPLRLRDDIPQRVNTAEISQQRGHHLARRLSRSSDRAAGARASSSSRNTSDGAESRACRIAADCSLRGAHSLGSISSTLDGMHGSTSSGAGLWASNHKGLGSRSRRAAGSNTSRGGSSTPSRAKMGRSTQHRPG